MRLDPITFEVLRNSLRGLCDEASELFARLAYAPTISEGHDFSGAVLTATGLLVAHGTRDQAPHIGSFEPSVRQLLKVVPSFSPGDVYVFNDPYTGGTHVNDVKLMRPILLAGELFAFACHTGHWPDVGGALPGSFNPRAVDCYSEGLRLPPLRLFEGDVINPTIQALIEMNMRTGRERLADIYAQHRAGLLVEERLRELAERHGKGILQDLFADIFDQTEAAFLSQVAVIPDGAYEFEDFSDRDVMHPDQPRIRVHCVLHVEGGRVRFDFCGSDPAPRGPFGFPRPSLLSAVYDGTLHCFPGLAPLNHGLTRSVSVQSTPGSCVDIQEPTPASGYACGAYEKVAAVTMACWAQAFATVDPRRVHAAGINLANLCIGGVHPRTGKQFVNYLWNEGGQGARSYKDGNSFQMMIFIGGATNQPIEILERWYPILFTHCEAVPDSCGAGTFRGGCGIDRSFVAEGEITLTMHGDRADVTPFGLAGGRNGGPNVLRLRTGAGGPEQDLGMYAMGIVLRPGDHVIYRSNGGGGYGDPLRRDPERVRGDVAAGWVTAEHAGSVYGIVLRDGVVDEVATSRRRAELAECPPDRGYGWGQVHPLGERVLGGGGTQA